MLKINGVEIAPPKTFSVDVEDLDSDASERNANGLLNRDRIAVKRKLNCEWAPLTNSEISKILTVVKDIFFEVEFPDPQEGRIITKTMYVGNRSAAVYTWSNGTVKWQGLKMNIVER